MEASKLSRSYVPKIEGGQRPSMETVVALVQVLNQRLRSLGVDKSALIRMNSALSVAEYPQIAGITDEDVEELLELLRSRSYKDYNDVETKSIQEGGISYRDEAIRDTKGRPPISQTDSGSAKDDH